MKINKKLLVIFLIMLAGLQSYTHAWMATLKVMQHPNGQIVRLAGDLHLEGFIEDLGLETAMKQEEIFLRTIEDSLTKFLDLNIHECFVVEKIAALNPDLIEAVLLHYNIAAVPLITRINILGHPQIKPSIKLKAAHIDKYTLQAKMEIIPYDVRSKYHKLCEVSFPDTQQEFDLYCKILASHQQFFKNDVQQFIEAKDKYDPIFHEFITTKGYSLLEDIERGLKLEDFFSYSFADFGYIAFIAQNTYKNITLYLGVQHCQNLAQDLEKIGYKTIFKKGIYDEEALLKNIIPEHPSKKEYLEFFSIG